MRFLRLRSISRRIQLLHEYGNLASNKLAMNVFGAFALLAGSLLGGQRSSAQATSTSPLTAVDMLTSAAMPASGARLLGIRTASSVTVNPTRLLSTRYGMTERSKL